MMLGLQMMDNPLFVVGGCVPPQCNSKYLSQYKTYIADYFNGVMNSTIYTKDNIIMYNPGEQAQEISKVSAGTIVTFLLLTVSATASAVALIYEYREQLFEEDRKKKPLVAPQASSSEDLTPAIKRIDDSAKVVSNFRKILTCFNIGKNAGSLFYSTNKTDKHLDILNGLRVFSMIWIILGHSLIEIFAAPVFNLEDAQAKIMQSRYMTIFTSATLSVDVFFMLSAFLATLACTQIFAKAERRKVSSVLLMYLQRYLRLLPIYVVSILTAIYIMPILYEGPIYTRITTLKKNCPENWIWNLLYINNFVKPNEACLPWSWYLSNDFQFFLIVPLIVLLYYKRKSLAYLAMGGLAVCSVLIQLGIIYGKNIDLYLFDAKVQVDFYEHYYIKPYCRLNTYLIGIVFAWIYMNNKEKGEDRTDLFVKINETIKNVPAVRYVLYILGVLIIFILFYVYPDFYMSGRASVTSAAAYSILGRPLFALGILAIVYPGLLGKCRICVVLTNELWGFMARCTYSAYMIHLIIFGFYVSTMEEGVYFRIHRVILNAIDITLLTYLISPLLTLLFESPVIQLSKMFLTPGGQPQKVGSKEPLAKSIKS